MDEDERRTLRLAAWRRIWLRRAYVSCCRALVRVPGPDLLDCLETLEILAEDEEDFELPEISCEILGVADTVANAALVSAVGCERYL